MEDIAESAINQQSNIQVKDKEEKVLTKDVIIEGEKKVEPNLLKKAIDDVKTINWKQFMATQLGMFIGLFLLIFIMLTYLSPPFVRIQKEHGHSYYSVQKTLIYSLLFSSLMFVIPFILKHWNLVQDFFNNILKMFKK